LKDLLLVTPPFTQLNTPYPATAYLKGFLNTKHISSYQMDLGIEVILELFSKKSFEFMFAEAYKNDRIRSENSRRIYALRHEYLLILDEIVQFYKERTKPLPGKFARKISCPKLPVLRHLTIWIGHSG